jgi:hypothetical protein
VNNHDRQILAVYALASRRTAEVQRRASVVRPPPIQIVVAELTARFRGRFDEENTLGYATAAVEDLLASIDDEALPEMAMRLAAVRMTRALTVGSSAWVTRARTCAVPVSAHKS